MTPEEYQLARELFHELGELSREAALRALRARSIDAAVRAEVESLLGYSERDDEFDDERVGSLGRDLVGRRRRETGSGQPPERIGDYTVLHELGEGGMGVVYAARRAGSEEVHAVKVIRPGLGSEHFHKRFRREAEVLRELRHAGIAAFYDSGEARVTVAGGRQTSLLFLAMELVEGESIYHYAATQQLDDMARLELMARVCDAVHHAHLRGIVHRDLKPPNVLVVESEQGQLGQPKVLDFGVAQASNANLQTLTQTHQGALIGTVPYMSPEQVSGGERGIDARSDVYSLGVMLYELLSGKLPLDVKDRPIPAAARIILEQDPVRLGSVVTHLRGPVELIVATALEKDPGRRYASAAAFATDLRHFIAGYPLDARAPTWSHQIGKFARRHRVLVAGVVAAFFALSIGLVSTTWFAVRESRARDRADDNARISAATAYRARISAASAAMSLSDVVDAYRQLNGAPELHRGWEWEHLHSRLDDSLTVIDGLRPAHLGNSGLALHADGTTFTVLCADRNWERAQIVVARLDDGSILHERELRDYKEVEVGTRGDWIYGLTWGLEVDITPAAGPDPARDVRIPVPLSRPPGVQQVIAASTPGDMFCRDGTNFYRYDPTLADVRHVPDVGASVGLCRPAVAQGGSRLAWHADGALWVRDLPGGKTLSWTVGAAPIQVLVFNDDATRLALLRSQEPSFEVWDVQGEAARLLWTSAPHADDVLMAAFSHDGTRVASTGEDRTVRLWDAHTGALLSTQSGHRGSVLELSFSHDDERLVSLGADGSVRTWATTSGDPHVLEHASFVYCAAFSPDGSSLYTAAFGRPLRVFDSLSGSPVASFPEPAAPVVIASVAVHPGGEWIAVAERELEHAGHSGSIRLLDVVSGTELRRLPAKGSIGSHMGVAVSPDGARLAVHDSDEGVRIFDTATWQVLATSPTTLTAFERHPLAFSPDGSTLAATGGDSSIVLFDAEDLTPRRVLSGHDGGVHALAFHPSGTELASASADWTVRIWNLEHESLPRILRGHTDAVYALAYAPDGARIATGSNDRSLRLWDAAEGHEIARLRGHGNYLYAVAFNPNGSQIVSGSGDNTARIWDWHSAAARLRAREQYAATLPKLNAWVSACDDAGEVAAVAARIRADPLHSERQKQIALQLLLGRNLE